MVDVCVLQTLLITVYVQLSCWVCEIRIGGTSLTCKVGNPTFGIPPGNSDSEVGISGIPLQMEHSIKGTVAKTVLSDRG